MTETLKIRPYARLLTMLGEQLIKNERIALMELIKNAYDADATWVKISFCGFSKDYQILKDSKIIIEDDGHGMTEETIKKHWMNPATPGKMSIKGHKGTTKSGRVLQGEKGIGRFALLKLGQIIDVITRATDEEMEHVIRYNFGQYDNEFLKQNGKEKELFLEDLEVEYFRRSPEHINEQRFSLGSHSFTRKPQGTRLEISDLKGSWSKIKIVNAYKDISRLGSIFPKNDSDENIINTSNLNNFNIFIYENSEKSTIPEDNKEELKLLMEDRSVIRIEEGRFDEKTLNFKFLCNGTPRTLNLHDPIIKGISVFRKHFGQAGDKLKTREIACGSFNFSFYIFDFRPQAPAKFKLDKKDKEILRSHRIYLYRDGVRVYPYGEPNDDWLKIDVFRGTISAGDFLSNDQVMGYVTISHDDNPHLKDKTSREGLIEEGDASEDFIALLQTFLYYTKKKLYDRYRADLNIKEKHLIHNQERIQTHFNNLKSLTKENKQAQAILMQAEKEYKLEHDYLIQRAETTEDLAGVGLSVETASHDIMSVMDKAMRNITGLYNDLRLSKDCDKETVLKEIEAIRGSLGFVEAQMKDIQLLFKSSKRRRTSIRVIDIFKKVEQIYKRILEDERIKLTTKTKGSPLIVKTTDAVLLQLLLNLIDNAVYWLTTTSQEDKKIEILFNGETGQMIFSDNGPGIEKDDEPYIFEPFFSGKGEEGRGLGLYIARQLLERNDYSINLAELKSDKKLPGANFIVNFFNED